METAVLQVGVSNTLSFDRVSGSSPGLALIGYLQYHT